MIELLRESPFREEVGKVIHESAICANTNIRRLEKGASIARACVKKPVKELRVHGTAEDGAPKRGVVLSRFAVEAFKGESTLQRFSQLSIRQWLCKRL